LFFVLVFILFFGVLYYIPRKKAKKNDVMAPSGIGQKRRDEHPFYQKRECSVFEMMVVPFVITPVLFINIIYVFK
jgi:hypothetical protein